MLQTGSEPKAGCWEQGSQQGFGQSSVSCCMLPANLTTRCVNTRCELLAELVTSYWCTEQACLPSKLASDISTCSNQDARERLACCAHLQWWFWLEKRGSD